MEVIMDKTDKELIEKTRNGEYRLLLFTPNQEKCSLELKILDSYKLSYFLGQTIYDNDFKEHIKEKCGFEIKAVSMTGVHTDLQNVCDEILDVLDKHGIPTPYRG